MGLRFTGFPRRDISLTLQTLIKSVVHDPKLGSVSMQSILIWQVAVKALGAHVYEIPLSRFETYSKVTYAATPLFTFVANFAKLSLAMFYFKLSPQRWFRNACWATVIGTFINWLVLTMLALFKCKHVRDGYDVRHRAIADHSQCIDAAKQYIATSATNILIDVVLFLLPIPMIVKLRLSKQQKAGAILIFAIGSMTVATSIVRAAYVSQILQTKDPPWDGANGSVWS
ncbi:hypothetical protein KEM55_002199 [Ascosphaera atra]|nr:hypothetical protein KEM55_002199 [Ascosphaera atra]